MIATKMICVTMALALGLCAFGPASAKGEILSMDDHLALEAGSTTEWDGGDYVAINMTKGDSLAWFGVVYGNDTHDNSPTIISAHLRFLGGAEIRNEDGAIMVPATGLPVLTIYIHKLAALIEFSDDGYLDLWSGDEIGADNGLFDFENTGEGISDFGIGSVEPVHKILDLNRSWERSDIIEIRNLNNTEREWTFTLSAKNVLYDKIWDNEPPEFEDGSRAGRESDGKVHDITFSFHIGTQLDEYNVSVPWYRVTYADGHVVGSEEVEPRVYEGTSLVTEFKFDHWIKDWDYQSQDNLLMLETVTAFGTFIPNVVQDWLDVQFINATSEEAAGVAELETFTGGETDIMATDGIPEGAHRLSKDTITFRDNWQKVGEMSWVSNVTVDNEEKEIYFQIHAGENIDWPGENDDGYVKGIIFIGGYIYPMGHDIFHDPSYTAYALFLDINVGFDIFGLLNGAVIVGILAIVVGVVVLASAKRIWNEY